ncbi:hypothetical protein LWI28_023020 [Acer negundo]|uniref:Neprosin PEP catalytic domain-containing protein n=1 Tax=Acer negundo TaxID=4023 RepID=A0AAD5NY85_ACENE|nr:hypothetical protein LWI28_023020 [Acer negundo]
MDQVSMAMIWVEGGPLAELNSIQFGWATNIDPCYVPKADGSQKTGCYNLICPGFIQVHPDYIIGSPYEPISVTGGKTYATQPMIYKDPESGNWWLFLDTNLKIGYWPKEILPHLSKAATFVQYGGLTYSSPNGLSPPMGNGHFPTRDTHESCFFAQLQTVNKFNNLVDIEQDSLQKVSHDLAPLATLELHHLNSPSHVELTILQPSPRPAPAHVPPPTSVSGPAPQHALPAVSDSSSAAPPAPLTLPDPDFAAAAAPPDLEPSSVAPPALPAELPSSTAPLPSSPPLHGHHMITRLRDGVRQPKVRTDGTVRYPISEAHASAKDVVKAVKKRLQHNCFFVERNVKIVKKKRESNLCDSEVQGGSVEPAHHHTFRHNLVVMEGRKSVWNLSEGEKFDLGVGDYLFSPAGDVHRVKYYEDTVFFIKWDGHWDMFFDEDLETAKSEIDMGNA